jgi:hypothetical protein
MLGSKVDTSQKEAPKSPVDEGKAYKRGQMDQNTQVREAEREHLTCNFRSHCMHRPPSALCEVIARTHVRGQMDK